ncbi:hypothetical protein PFICI_08699 [Pestalotiopsis fici W106-1]|uniref:Uncharacterized protein n=1 Tax=Pestalotiopsis fici (strain W106-1 / CGMCC3.15140) TaxID=1229662 RepID=W3X113_PESFW|nr:uncharacterized protein PFICI_08699 [Pestalotiopsis fici W106-1]ETS78846.1 hypothetical protein PFICI_08699 [Pestalotiopsis fici W106-1]
MRLSASVGLLAVVAIAGVAAQDLHCGDTTHAFTCGQAQITGQDCLGDCNCQNGGQCAGFSDINDNDCPAADFKNVCFRADNGPDCECR